MCWKLPLEASVHPETARQNEAGWSKVGGSDKQALELPRLAPVCSIQSRPHALQRLNPVELTRRDASCLRPMSLAWIKSTWPVHTTLLPPLTRRDTSFLRPISPSTPSIRLLALATSFSTCGHGGGECSGACSGECTCVTTDKSSNPFCLAAQIAMHQITLRSMHACTNQCSTAHLANQVQPARQLARSPVCIGGRIAEGNMGPRETAHMSAAQQAVSRPAPCETPWLHPPLRLAHLRPPPWPAPAPPPPQSLPAAPEVRRQPDG